MTCRSSYFKLCLEDMKRRLIIVIITLVLFAIYGISFLFSFLNQFTYWEVTREEIIASIVEMCAPSGAECVLGMLMGVFLAAQGFAYLHSKRQMDFYGALPISRTRRFSILCTNQIVLFTIPFLLIKAMQILVIAFSGYGSKEAYVNVAISTLCVWLGFMAMWAITAVAVIITGHLALSLAGVAVITAYVPLVRFVVLTGCCAFLLDTYAGGTVGDFWYIFSPFSALSKVIPDWGETWAWKTNGIWLPVLALYAIVFGIVAYVTFLKRNNETTGKAMAFPKWNRLIQIMLSIPCGILCGLVTGIWVAWINVWLIIPFAIVGCCFVHLLLECIFHYNIRKVFIHKWQMIITAVLSVCILLFIGLDFVGYDSYLPKAEDIRAVYVNTYSGEDMLYVEDLDLEVEMSDELKGTILNFVEPVLHASEMEEVKEFSLDTLFDDTNVYVDVTYVTSRGKVKQRSYAVAEGYDLSGISSYYDTEEYRKIISMSRWKVLEDMQLVEWRDAVTTEELQWTEEEYKELFDIYRKEFYKVSLNTPAIGELYVLSGYDVRYDYYTEGEPFYIYESCTETIAYLESKGVDMFMLDDCEIEELEIYYYEEGMDEEEYITITDKELIEKYKEHFKVSYYLQKSDSNYTVWAVSETVDSVQIWAEDDIIKQLVDEQK